MESWSGQHRGLPRGVAVGVIVGLIAGAARLALNPLLGDLLPFITFLPAITVAAWAAAIPGGLATLAVGIVVAAAFLMPPFAGLEVHDWTGLTLFMAGGLLTTALGGQLHRARHAAERGRLRTSFLADASRALHADLDRRQALEGVTRAVVPSFADWCAIDLFAPDGTFCEAIIATPDPARTALAHRLRAEYPYRPDAPMGVPAVFRTGVPEAMLRVPARFFQAIPDARLRSIMEGLQIRSFISVPIRASLDRASHGVLTVVMAASGREFEAADEAIAVDLGRRVGVALDHADLYAEARRRREALEDVVGMLDDAALVASADGAITIANPAAERTLGPQLVGSRLDQQLAALVPVAAGPPGAPTVRAPSGRYLVARTAERSHPDAHLRIAVLRDVTDLVETQAARDAFVGMLSHELRTPVTTIFGAATLLRRMVDERTADLVGDLILESDRLHRLVEDLLVLARFEHGELRIAPEPVLVQRLASQVLNRAATDYPHLRLHVLAPGDLPPALGDPTAIEQVLRNLLSNAVKYAGESARITVSIGQEGSEVVVRFQDDGPGIPAEARERIFGLYERLSATASRPGAGIGLFVSRHLCETMGGSLRAIPSDVGAAFEIRLPAVLAAVESDVAAEPDAAPAGTGSGRRTTG